MWTHPEALENARVGDRIRLSVMDAEFQVIGRGDGWIRVTKPDWAESDITLKLDLSPAIIGFIVRDCAA